MSAKSFAKNHLTNVTWPSKDVSKNELWDVSGILKDRSNEVLRFDVRPLKNKKMVEQLKEAVQLPQLIKRLLKH